MKYLCLLITLCLIPEELRDAQGYGQPEFADLLYTCAGEGIGSYLIGEMIK